MKKFILLFLVILCSGCGKKLTCTYEDKYEDVTIKNKIVFNFSDNTYKEKDMMVFSDKDEALKYFKDIEEYIDEYNLILNDNKIISEIEDKIKLDGTIKEIKKQYESYDYKCK